MLVRVFDKHTGTYFRSEVYAKINVGWHEKQLVRVPCKNGDYMRFYDCLDKDIRPVKGLINTIVQGTLSEWIHQKTGSVDTKLSEYENTLQADTRFFEFYGFSWLYEDVATLARLVEGEAIPVCGSVFEHKRLDYHRNGWEYIETQDDVDRLMDEAAGFHDTILKSLHYVSGGYVSTDRSMHPFDDERRVTMVFESQITNPVEIVFEGVTALNLRPADDHYTSNVLAASLNVKDCTVFFCDEAVSAFDMSYEGTWITSYSMRWRFIQ